MYRWTWAMNNVEINLSDDEFREFRDIVNKTTGISLADSKKALVISRLARRLSELNIQSFIKYIHRLRGDSEELLFMVNRITTNLTRFYREKGQFVVLKEKILPHIMGAKREKKEKFLRIWSAGCSTGEEVYTILFELLDYFGGRIPAGLDCKILGSDIDTNVLKKAKSGRYTQEEVNGLDKNILERYFKRTIDGQYQVDERFRKYVLFTKLNLVYDEYVFNKAIDIIFCRNVVIYFSRDTKNQVYQKFYGVLNEPGYFFSGHSENLFPFSDKYKFVGKSVYKKVS